MLKRRTIVTDTYERHDRTYFIQAKSMDNGNIDVKIALLFDDEDFGLWVCAIESIGNDFDKAIAAAKSEIDTDAYSEFEDSYQELSDIDFSDVNQIADLVSMEFVK